MKIPEWSIPLAIGVALAGAVALILVSYEPGPPCLRQTCETHVEAQMQVNGDGTMQVVPVTQTSCRCLEWQQVEAGADG